MNKYLCILAIITTTVLATLIAAVFFSPLPTIYIESSQLESVSKNQQRSSRFTELIDKLGRNERLSSEETAEFELLSYQERQELHNAEPVGFRLKGNYPENNLTTVELDEYLGFNRKIVSEGCLSLTPAERKRYLFLAEKSATPQKQ